MANVIGNLFVELGINTAAFADGLNKATYSAKAGAQQIGASFQALGSQLAEVGSHFGEFGAIVGQSLGSAGNAVSKLVKGMGSFSNLDAPLKLAAVGVGAIGAAALTAGGAVVAIAIHATEAAKRLEELSQSTGVGVRELSGLNVVAGLVGVGTDQLAKGLERLDRNALTAVQAPAGAAAKAFVTLGIQTTDASGKIKSSSDLFAAVADKFSKMEDGATKTALALQLFGRAGAELIPMLNQGAASIKYWVDYGTQVGAVLDDKAAKGATAFQQELTKLSLISTGVQNKLMTALLPALEHITASLAEFLAKGSMIADFGNFVGEALTNIAAVVYRTAYAWDWWGAQIRRVGAITALVVTGQFRAIPDAIKLIDDDVKKASDHLQFELDALSSKAIRMPGPSTPARTAAAPVPIAGGAATAKLPVDEVEKYIKTLEAETSTQIRLAAAVANSTQEIAKQKAEAAAENEYTKLLTPLLEKRASLTQSLALAERGHTAATDQHVKQMSAEIDFTNKEISELQKNHDWIIELNKVKADASASEKFKESLVKEREALTAEIAGINQEIAAIGLSAAEKQKAAAEAAAGKFAAASGFAPGTSEYEAAYKQALDLNNQLQDAKYRQLAAQKALDLETSKGYTDEVNLIKAAMATDADNRDLQLAGMVQLQDAQYKVIKAWDNNALAVGTFGEKFKAVINQLNLESQNAGQKIAASFKTAFDGLSKNFAELVTTGKSNWKQLFTSLEQQIIQTMASKAFNDLLTKFMGLFSGGGGIGGGTSGGGGGGIGGAFGGILSLFGFGGGKAGGGPVAPGVAYLIGEKGPEAFIPRVPGTITPNSATMKATPMQGNVNVHVYGATDPDAFRKASPQIAAAVYSHMRMAAARNYGGGG